MKKQLLSLASAALLLFAACSKSTQPTVSSTPLLSYIIHNNADTTFFKYDAQRHLIEQYNKAQGGSFDYVYLYDISDRITEEDHYGLTNGVRATSYVKYNYNYSTAAMVYTTVTAINGTLGSTPSIIYTLNFSNQPTKVDYGNDGYIAYSYDNYGNVLVKSDYSPQTTNLLGRANYTYDGKKSYFYNVVGNLAMLHPTASPNNVLTYTHTASGAVDTFTSTFTYNTDGYPVTESRIVAMSGSVTVDTYTYVYK